MLGVVTTKSLAIGAAAMAALITLTACSSSDKSPQSTATASSTSAAAPAADAHNQADVTFAQQMIPHHQQAIQMSDTLLAKQGIDPRVIGLANQIKAAQGPEIQQMQGWLTQWGQPTSMPSMNMPGHDMPGMNSGQGMMSEQDMAALRNAQGVAASKLFLTQMITHHEGAIAMAQTEISSGQYPAAVAMARSIVTSQQQEIDTMKGIIGTL